MKIRAEPLSAPNKVRLVCTPFFGEEFVVYAGWALGEWRLSSGRLATRKMLSAIDRLPIFITKER